MIGSDRDGAGGGLDPAQISGRMSAIGHAMHSGGAGEDILLLTDVIEEGGTQSEAVFEPDSGSNAASAIAEVLLDSGGNYEPADVNEILRAEFRNWLESDGREVLAELLDDLVAKEESQR